MGSQRWSDGELQAPEPQPPSLNRRPSQGNPNQTCRQYIRHVPGNQFRHCRYRSAHEFALKLPQSHTAWTENARLERRIESSAEAADGHHEQHRGAAVRACLASNRNQPRFPAGPNSAARFRAKYGAVTAQGID